MANFVDREALQEREQKFYNEYPMDTLKLQPLFSTTKYGMPIYKDQYEAIHSESSITLPIEINNEEKFITVSSIWPSDPEGKPSGSKELTGKYWKDYELRPFIRDNLSENKKFFINPITQERVPVFNTDTEANKYALDRDMSLQNVSEYRQDHIFQEGGNVMAEDNDNNNQQIYTREQMDKVGFSSWRGQDPEARLPVVNVGSVPAAVSLRDDWMGKKLEEPLTNREKEISAYLRIFTENPNPSIDITNQSQMRALEILNQIPHTHIQTGGAAIRSVLSNPDDPKNKAFINNNKRVLVQAFPILSKHDEGSGRGSFPIVKPQYNVGVGHEEQLQHQQGLVKKQPSVTKSTQSVRSDSVEEPETLGRPKFAKDDAFEEDQLNESRRDFLQKKINEYRIAIADGPDAQMKFARQLSENPNFSQDFKDAVFQSVDVGSPKRGFVSPTVSSVQEDDKRGDARLAESLFQSPKPRKPDRGPYEMGTKDYGRRKSLRNQTPEQKIANEVDQLRSANLISDTSQDMSGVASAIKTAMSQHEVNPDFTNSDTARAYQILQELPTNVQTGPATLSSLIENPTDEENRNFMKKHAPVLYQAFPALRAIYDRDIQSATPANIQDLADVVGLDNLPPAMQERILTKREKQFGSGSTERKDDFHDTEGLAARGGLIGYQMGAEVQTNPMRTGSEGFIGTREEGREDRAMALQNGDMGTDGVDATVDEGSFVLNSWAVALAGRQYIEELVKKAKQYIASPEGRAQLGNRELQPEEIDIRVSNGEYVFPPAMVEIIGRERLEKMNNRGIQAFEEEQRGRPEAMAMQESEGLVPRPDQIPQNPAQEGGLPQQQIGAHRGGTIGGTKGIIRELEELFYGFEPEPEPKSMLLVMGEKDEKNESPSKQLGGFVSNNGSKKNYARGDLVSISPPIPEMKPTKDNSFVHRSGSIPLHSEVSGKSKVLKRREPREAHIEQVAKIIYGEGRGEKEEGMKAIAHVIRNRLNRDKKRSTKEFTNGYFYQSVVAKPLAFSVTNPNLEKGTKEYANQQKMEEAYKNYKDPSKKSDEEFLRAIQIARDLFQNNLGKDITKGAVMYHSATMKQQDVNWNFKKLYETIRIGNHIFYNYRDSRPLPPIPEMKPQIPPIPEMKPQKFDDGGFVKKLLEKYDESSKITEPVLLGLIQSGKELKEIYDKSGVGISIKKGKISKKGNISDILPFINTKGEYNLEVDPTVDPTKEIDAYIKFTIPFST